MEFEKGVRRYIEDADYPARAQDLLAVARSGEAPEGVLERLSQLPTNAQFSDADEVVEELENPEGPGEDQVPPGGPAEACRRLLRVVISRSLERARASLGSPR